MAYVFHHIQRSLSYKTMDSTWELQLHDAIKSYLPKDSSPKALQTLSFLGTHSNHKLVPRMCETWCLGAPIHISTRLPFPNAKNLDEKMLGFCWVSNSEAGASKCSRILAYHQDLCWIHLALERQVCVSPMSGDFQEVKTSFCE